MLHSLQFFEKICQPIQYTAVSDEVINQPNFKRNVLLVGTIGQGKSATINKINHWLTVGDPNSKIIKVVVSKSSTETVTIGSEDLIVESIHNHNIYRLIDSQGFGDSSPLFSNDILWQKLLIDLQKQNNKM